MGHTNSTVNYNLPQFVGTDKPSWLGDVNGAFLAIDNAIAAAKTEADSAAGGVAGLQTTVGSHTTQIGTLTDTVTAQGGTLNSVTALIGNGTPTTTDKTIIGAINEINAKISKSSVSVTADGVKTNEQLLNALFALVDMNKISSNSKLIIYIAGTPADQYIPLTYKSATELIFSSSNLTTTALSLGRFDVQAAGSETYTGSVTGGGSLTITNTSSNALTAGWKYEVVY